MSASEQRPDAPGVAVRKIALVVVAIVGTILVSVATAFFAFGQSQSDSITRLEGSEAEDARQREVDQAIVTSLNDALERVLIQAGELDTRIAVNEAQIEALAREIERILSQP